MSYHNTTCADAAIQQLLDAGVNVCFANPGTTEMYFVSSLRKHEPAMRSILCLHEAVCTGACDGYARIRGQPAVALLHLGPGLSNGLCNLHNAHRARSPILTLVGEHATWHRASDPPLVQHIEALACSVSGHVCTVQSAQTMKTTLQTALVALRYGCQQHGNLDVSRAAAAVGTGGHHGRDANTAASQASSAQELTTACVVSTCSSSRVVTVVFPHDVSWETAPAAGVSGPTAPEAPPQLAAQQLAASLHDGLSSGSAAAEAKAVQPSMQTKLSDSPAAMQFLRQCAAALQAAPRGKAALVLGGTALRVQGNALLNAGRVAAALGAALLCDPLPAVVSRGAGLPHCTRLPYFPQEAAAELRKYEVILLADIKRPVATFGYKDGPSQLLSQHDDVIWELDVGYPVAEALELLVGLTPGAAKLVPGVSCGGAFAAPARPPLPTGRLTAATLCQAVAALQPDGTILVDESLTSGTVYWEASKGCPSFDHLCLTGGAIGSGPPMSVGAAVAAGKRQVINLQADGSAMYTLQALWTQVCERLQVLTIICANNTYAILQIEAMRQRTGQVSRLTSLAEPAIDWVALATGMGVPAGRADSCDQLVELIRKGMQQQGPFLIHAALN